MLNIEQAIKLKLSDIHCLIRPRAGHFTYSKEEVKIIEQDIVFAREVGCNGVVVMPTLIHVFVRSMFFMRVFGVRFLV